MATMYRILGKRGRITIPIEMRMRVGFAQNDLLSFSETEDGKAVLVRREKICDNCNSPLTAANDKEMTLLEFLDGLSDAEQHAALERPLVEHHSHQRLRRGVHGGGDLGTAGAHGGADLRRGGPEGRDSL